MRMNIVEMINIWGQGFVGFGWPMLIQSCVLIVIMLGVDWAIRKRVRAVVRYWLWMLVMVKLVLPTSLTLPTGVGYWVKVEEPKVLMPVQETRRASSMAKQGEELEVPPREVPAGLPVVNFSESVKSEEKPVVEERLTQERSVVDWRGVVFIAWLVVAGGMSLLVGQRYVFVRGLIRQATPAEGKIAEIFEECAEKMGISRRPVMKMSATMVSPAACGLIRPVVIMPEFLPTKLSEKEMRAVLLHELAHIQRGDLWVNCVQTLLQVVYFYNPLLWLANGVIRRIREQAVDETVLVTLREEAGQYPETLLNVAKLSLARPALSLRMVGVVESKSALAERIKHMINRPFPKSAKIGGVGLAGIVVVGALLLPMARGEQKKGVDPLDAPSILKFDQQSIDKKGTLTINEFEFGREVRVDLAIAGEKTAKMNVASIEFSKVDDQIEALLKIDSISWPKTCWEIQLEILDGQNNVLADKAEIFENSGVILGTPLMESKTLIIKQGKVKGIENAQGFRLQAWAMKKEEKKMVGTAHPTATDEKPLTDKSENDKTFKATFSNGVTAELAGVAYHPSKGKQWWRADGSELNISPCDWKDDGSEIQAGEKQKEYIFVIELANLSDRSLNRKWKISPSLSTHSSNYCFKEGSRAQGFYGSKAVVASDVTKVNVSFGLAAGEWKPCVASNGKVRRTDIVRLDDKVAEITLMEVYQVENRIQIEAKDNALNYANRIIAIDKENKIHQASPMSSILEPPLRLTTARFDNLKLDQIKEFQFQIRPYEWVEFKNVSLEPGVKTNVEIVDGKVEKKIVGEAHPRATFSNGVTVELAGVAYHPSKGKEWWGADGSKLEYALYDRMSGHASPGKKNKTLEIVFKKVEPTTAKGAAYVWHCLGCDFISGDALDETGQSIKGLEPIAITIPKEKNTVNLRYGMAAGEWKTYAEYSGGGGSSLGTEIGGIVFAEPNETDEYLVINVSLDIDEMDTRIIAVDKDGSTHTATRHSSGSAGKSQLSTYKFQNLRKAQIKEYQFQARPYEWIEFKNVSLEPGNKTNVEIVGDKDEKKLVGEARSTGNKAIEGKLPDKYISQLPKLEYLARQVDDGLSRPQGYWYPNGEKVTDEKTLTKLKEMFPTGFSSSYVQKLKVLHFWFSHPLFDKESLGLIELYDQNGKSITQLNKSGEVHFSCSFQASGWLSYTVAAVETTFSKSMDVQLRYSLGPWTTLAILSADDDGVSTTFNGLYTSLGPIGQKKNGKTFITLNVDRTKNTNTQFGFTAIMQDGGEVPGTGKTESGPDSQRVIMYEFDQPLMKVKEFRLRLRPIQTLILKNVSLEPGVKTDVEIVRDKDEKKMVGTAHPTAGKEDRDVKVYSVNRRVSDFSDEEDFSTPESAYAAINRVSARGDVEGWEKVSVKELAEKLAGERKRGKMDVPAEWAKVLLNAEILEVCVWKNEAVVMAKLLQEFSTQEIRRPIDVRYLRLENDRWLNVGNDRVDTVAEGELMFKRRIDDMAKKVVGEAHPTTKGVNHEQFAVDAAQMWLELVDEEKYAESWQDSSELFKGVLTENHWVEIVTPIRRPLGKVISRKMIAIEYTTNVPGAPDGEYVVIQFQTVFENKKEAVETVTPMKDKDGRWRVSGYYIK